MKKIGVSFLILALLVATCVFALVSCSDVTQSISYNNVIESKYGDSFLTTDTQDAPEGALEYTSLKRITRKYLIDGRVVGRHTLGLYMPRGEAITVKIDAAEIGNKHEITINENMPLSEVPYKLEIDSTEKSVQRMLAGGLLELNVKAGAATTFEVTISGCIEAPCYRYGIDDETAFGNIANYNVLDCTNVRIYVQSSNYAKIDDAKKVMNWWRNAVTFMDQLLGLSFWAKDYSPMCIYFRNQVSEDAIVDSANNCIYLPTDYIDALVDYKTLSQDAKGKLFRVLGYIAQEKVERSGNYADTFLKDHIKEVLAQLTYIDMVDAYVIDNTNPKYAYTDAGVLEKILSGEFESETQKYCALFNYIYYNTNIDYTLYLLKTINELKLSDSLAISYLANECKQNMIPLANKLDIALYGEDIINMQQYEEVKLVANKATYGRDYKAAQCGYHVRIGESANIDFKSLIVSEEEFEVEGVYGQEGAWARQEDGTFIYTPNENKLKDSYRLNLKAKDGKVVSLYGNITVDIAVSEYDVYNDVSCNTLDEAIKQLKNMTITTKSSILKAEIPRETQESESKSFAVAKGAFEIEETGTYYLYLKSSGLCSVKFGVEEYSEEIFRNSLTVGNYTQELSYKAKLEKGYKYIYTIYNLSNQGSGFATLGIQKGDGEIEDIDDRYLVYPKLTRNNIVEYINPQKYIDAIDQQEVEYTPIKTAKIAQFMNIDEYEIGQVSEVIEKNSKVSFVLPFSEISVVNYLMINVHDMEDVKLKLYGGTSFKQNLAEETLVNGDNIIEFNEMNIDGIKLEFTSPKNYRLAIDSIIVGKYVSAMSIVPSTSTDIEYISEWATSKEYIAINGSLAVTQSKDSELSYSFNGNEISIYATVGPMFGSAKITIDGQDKGQIDLNNIKVNCSQLVYTTKLKDGDHVLKISAVDETPINLDYLAVAAFGETQNKNDFSKLWYVAIIPGILIIVAIVFISLDIREKKKSKEIKDN